MKKIILTIIALLIIAAGIGYYFYNKSPESAAFLDAHVTTSASTLLQDFDMDEAAANDKYLGKVVEVSGELKEVVEKDGSYVLLLGEENMMGGYVSCTLDESFNEMAHGLISGDQVIVKGKCTGVLLDVILTDCSVKNKNAE